MTVDEVIAKLDNLKHQYTDTTNAWNAGFINALYDNKLINKEQFEKLLSLFCF